MHFWGKTARGLFRVSSLRVSSNHSSSIHPHILSSLQSITTSPSHHPVRTQARSKVALALSVGGTLEIRMIDSQICASSIDGAILPTDPGAFGTHPPTLPCADTPIHLFRLNSIYNVALHTAVINRATPILAPKLFLTLKSQSNIKSLGIPRRSKGLFPALSLSSSSVIPHLAQSSPSLSSVVSQSSRPHFLFH